MRTWVVIVSAVTVAQAIAQTPDWSGQSDLAPQQLEQYMAPSGKGSAPDDPLERARSLMRSGDWNAARDRIRQYLASHKGSADGHYLLGYVLFKQKDAKASLAEYTEGARYRKPSAYDLEVVGCDYVLLHDYTDADRWFSQAVAWDPGNFQALYYLGRTKYNENRFEEAVQVFTDCLKLNPRSVLAEENLGLSYEGLNRIDDAMAAYRTAIAWQSTAEKKDPGPYINLGALLVTNSRAREAVPLLEEAVRLDASEMRAHRELGKAYSSLDQLDPAQRELERAVELAPDLAASHYVLAQVYRKRGLAEKADAELARYRALAGKHSADQ